MIGDSTERKMMRKKAFDNKYLGFKSSTANKAKAMIYGAQNEAYKTIY